MDHPSIRAGFTQALLEGIERLPREEREAVLDRVAPQSLETIRGILPIAMIDFAPHMDLSNAITDTVGSENTVELWSGVMLRMFDRPLMRSFVRMSMSLFGISPASLYRQSNRIYAHLTRELGVLRSESQGPGHELVVLDGFPADRWRLQTYVEGLHGCLQGAIRVAQRPGDVVVLEVDEAAGRVRYEARWTEPATRPA